MRRHRGCKGYMVMGQEERRHTGAGTEDGPRWKSAAFGGTGQENWLTTFRTGSELPNRSPIPPSYMLPPFLDDTATMYAQICGQI
ncbi:hypothetical protein ALC53_09610 [Atta colombica]|uniref:Uncharacterized protein n=1 Tax=Atta colombica TaxID=520822 RepID=A0A151I1G0_9HYME|nr:hypothetical protein ALC53_09610 [Atta colombica]